LRIQLLLCVIQCYDVVNTCQTFNVLNLIILHNNNEQNSFDPRYCAVSVFSEVVGLSTYVEYCLSSLVACVDVGLLIALLCIQECLL